MTFDLDPDELIRAGRTAEVAAGAAADGRCGDRVRSRPRCATREALARLQRRVHRLASRIGANGRSLQAFVRDAEAVDSQVSFRFLVLSATGWR